MFLTKLKSLFFLCLILMAFTSCLSRKKFDYFQDKSSLILQNDSTAISKKYQHKIRPDDILSIFVASLSPEASSFFNPTVDNNGTLDKDALPLITGYLVDIEGNVELPLIGTIHVSDLTLIQARDTIRSKLEDFLVNPSVRIYIDNFKLTVLGEVTRPGIYTLPTEKITISEALALAGDITVFGIRTDILVVRENDKGEQEYGHLDISSREIFKSKYYYLQPNDVVYVSARKTKITSGDFFFKVAPLTISILTLLSVLYTRFY